MVQQLCHNVGSSALIGHLESRHSVLLSLNPWWKLEQLQLEALAGDAGAAIIEKKLLGCLPEHANKLWKVETAIAKVNDVEESVIAKLTGPLGLRRITILQDVLDRMKRGCGLRVFDEGTLHIKLITHKNKPEN